MKLQSKQNLKESLEVQANIHCQPLNHLHITAAAITKSAVIHRRRTTNRRRRPIKAVVTAAVEIARNAIDVPN